MNKNTIFIQYKNKMIVNEGSSNEVSKVELATILKNIESLGFTLFFRIINILKTYSMEEIQKFYSSLVKNIKKMVGAHRKFDPMYPNFPKQVMDMSEAELYYNAIMHYLGDWFGVRILPEYEKEERLPFLENTKLQVIDVGAEEEFHQIFTNLMSSKTSLSENDKDNIKWYIKKYKNSAQFPNNIPHKEILSIVAKSIVDLGLDATKITSAISSVTDALRIAVALSDGDVSLATLPIFKNFSRKERRFLLKLVDSCSPNTALEDAVRYKNVWIRLGEKLHPGEYKNKYRCAFEIFSAMRNNEKFPTFRGKVELAILEKKVEQAVDLLSSRPGEFARRLDHLLRINDNQVKVIDKFSSVANKVSTPVLLQVKSHFEHRNSKDNRVIFPKGNISKVQCIENDLPKINSKLCDKVVNICEKALIDNYSNLYILMSN